MHDVVEFLQLEGRRCGGKARRCTAEFLQRDGRRRAGRAASVEARLCLQLWRLWGKPESFVWTGCFISVSISPSDTVLPVMTGGSCIVR
jgi:hypothetical protein